MAASLAVSSPSTSSRHRAATCLEGYQPSSTCPLSVSRALRAFFHPGPAGFVSRRCRPWGFTLQGRSSLAEQYVLSDALALLGLAGLPGSVPAGLAMSGPEEPEHCFSYLDNVRTFEDPGTVFASSATSDSGEPGRELGRSTPPEPEGTEHCLGRRNGLPKTCPTSGLCSLRATVPPGRLFGPARRPRPSWVSPP